MVKNVVNVVRNVVNVVRNVVNVVRNVINMVKVVNFSTIFGVFQNCLGVLDAKSLDDPFAYGSTFPTRTPLTSSSGYDENYVRFHT